MYIYYASELLARASNPKTAAKPRQAHLANPIRLVIWSPRMESRGSAPLPCSLSRSALPEFGSKADALIHVYIAYIVVHGTGHSVVNPALLG